MKLEQFWQHICISRATVVYTICSFIGFDDYAVGIKLSLVFNSSHNYMK